MDPNIVERRGRENATSLYEKMIDEPLSIQRAIVNLLGSAGGRRLGHDDWASYLEALMNMSPGEGQVESPFVLHSASASSHINAVGDLEYRRETGSDILRLQAPAVLSILCNDDDDFSRSAHILADALGKAGPMIGREAIRRLRGDGKSDTRLIPSIIEGIQIPKEHGDALISALCWSSYRVGDIFIGEAAGGREIQSALDMEAQALEAFFRSPLDSPRIDGLGSSFDAADYIARYSDGVREAIIKSMSEGLSYESIISIASYAAGDVWCISRAACDLAGDDLAVEVLRSVAEVMETTLRGSLGRYTSLDQMLVLGTGAAACALDCILEMDGFSAPEIISLLGGHRVGRGQIGYDGFHYFDVVDMIYNGWRYIDNTNRKGKALSPEGLPVPRVTWFEVDLSPLAAKGLAAGSRRAPGTSRLSAILRLAECPAIITGGVTSALATNITAATGGEPVLPSKIYSKYIMGRLQPPGRQDGSTI